jgi:hypothetical protein
MAERAARDPQSPDISLLLEWQEVARHFPGLRSIPLRRKLRLNLNKLSWIGRSLIGSNGGR